MPFSNAFANSLLDLTFNETALAQPLSLWMQLHTDSPGGDCTANVYPGASRTETSWTSVEDGWLQNSAAITFSGLTDGGGGTNCGWFSLWTLESGGSAVAYGFARTLSSGEPVVYDGDSVMFPQYYVTAQWLGG